MITAQKRPRANAWISFVDASGAIVDFGRQWSHTGRSVPSRVWSLRNDLEDSGKARQRCGVTLFFRSQMQLWLAKALTSSTILAIES